MTDPSTDAEQEPEAEEEPFANRAARRAKGKKITTQTQSPTGHLHGRSGTVQSPRQYGNRRSG